jgi:ribosome-associated heat shock protein Hsp15
MDPRVGRDDEKLPGGTSSLRIDKWLWHARFCKSRNLATRLCSTGQIRLAQAGPGGSADEAAGSRPGLSSFVAKPSQTVRPGDVLTFPLGGQVRVVRILELGLRRGPAPEARLLYQDLTPPQVRLRQERGPGLRPAGSGRPTKRDRRALDRLREEET